MNAPSAAVISKPANRALHRLFLTLFLRGRSSRGLRRSSVPRSVFSKLAFTLILYALVGCFGLYFLNGPVFTLSLYLHGMTLVFCGLFIAASAGETLFNKEEADILLHRPISPQTLLRAKLTVLVQVSLWIAGAFNLAGTLGGFRAIDASLIFPVAHIISTVLEAVFCTSCVVLGYEFCLRCFGRELLENVMTAVQILVAVGAVAAGQIIPRMMTVVGSHVTFRSDVWWVRFLPPTWFAGFDDALSGSGAGLSWILGATGVTLTAITAWLALGRMARHYELGLQLLGETSTMRPAQGGRRRFTALLVHVPPFSWWLRHPVQRASFILVSSYLVRDRDVKLRVYPGMAPMLIMPVIMLLNGHQDVGLGSFGVAFAGTYLGMIPMLGVTLLQYSQQWAAADIFRIAPVIGPAEVCAGARKAVTCFLTVPLVIVYALITLLLSRDHKALALMLPGLIMLPIYTLVPNLGGAAVPLSEAAEEAKSARRGLVYAGATVVAAVIASLAIWAQFAGWFFWFLLGEIAVVTAIYVPLSRSLASTRWSANVD
ncbi:MAG TPA: hypothetical protein VGM54_01850 [Chthoniobacter sp.]|jgi:hypothetical protein